MLLSMGLVVILLKLIVLTGLWFNRRRIAMRLAAPRLDMERLAQHIGRELNLAREEREGLARGLAGYVRQVEELRRHNAQIRHRLLDEVAGVSLDRARLNDVYADKRALVEQAFVLLRDKFMAFHGRLTPAQRNKLARLLEKNMNHPLFSHPLLP